MSAAGVTIVHEAELVDPRQSGQRIRAYCHLHGGTSQRSLSIAAYGDAAGLGWCHSCHARVFVPELNPEEAARRERGQAREPRRITPASLLRPARPRPLAPQSAPAEWQRAELATLQGLAERMRARLADDRARAYLEARGIPYDVAAAAGVGYIPADVPARIRGVDIGKWRDRLMFPLGSPDGAGYAGRSLWGWRPGMDENAHKALLDSDPTAPRRWEKTYPAGWLGYETLAGADCAVLVEGCLDALALHAAALLDVPVVALVGTASRPEWLPDSVRGVVLALDGDGPGREAARNLARDLAERGLEVRLCAPPAEDGRGKDWSERWRLAEWEGVWPVALALDPLMCAPEPAPAAIVAAIPEPGHSGTPAEASIALHTVTGDDTAPWLADPLVCHLQARGLELAEGQAAPFLPLLAPGDWVLVCEAPEAHALAHRMLYKDPRGIIFCAVCRAWDEPVFMARSCAPAPRERHELQLWAEMHGWPVLAFKTGGTVRAGPDAWGRFLVRADGDDIRAAHACVCGQVDSAA